jgi:hypothetical protein
MLGNPTIVPDAQLVCDPNGFIVGQDQDFVGGGFDQNQSWAGAVDNLRIYSRALTAEEVLELCIQDGVVVSDVANSGNEPVPSEFSLRQNYPNPFNPITIIRYELPVAQHARLTLYNILGELVVVLADQDHSAGIHSATVDGRGLGSGTYFYRLESGKFSETKKLILLK